MSNKREYVALFVFIGMLSLLLSVILPGRSRAGNRDFICYWASSQLLEHGGNPYDETAAIALEHSEGGFSGGGMVLQAPPLALAFMMPLGLLSPRMANGLWTFLIVGCISVSVHVIRHMNGNPDNRIHLLGYAFAPVLVCLAAGQISAFLLLGISLFLLLYDRHPFAAGMALSVSSMKPHLLLPFGVALLFWTIDRKQSRLVVGLLSGFLLTVAAVLVVRPTVWGDYFTMMSSAHIEEDFLPTPSALLRLLIHPGWPWLQMVPAVLACLWAAWYYIQHRDYWEWAGYDGYLLLLVSLFVAPRCWTTDEVLALPALLFLFYSGRRPAALACLAAGSLIATGELFLQLRLASGAYVWTTIVWLACYVWAAEPIRRHALNPVPASDV